MKIITTSILVILTLIVVQAQRPAGGGERPAMTKEQMKAYLENAPRIGSIEGKVIDEGSSTPLEFATVALYLAWDSTLISGSITDEKGFFKLEELPPGSFYMTAEYLGYQTKTVTDIRINPRKAPNVTLEDIALSARSEIIDEVEVTADKLFMELKMDKKVYNVGDQLNVEGGSATDVMQNIPSVEVDIDGNLSLRGNQGVRILIDGRPTTLGGGDTQALLEQLPANSIDKVEVMTSPSAKYDPDGQAGIINIVLKKNKKIGLNGFVQAGVETQNRYNGSLNLSYRDKNVNLYTNYNFRQGNSISVNDAFRQTFLQDTTFAFDLDGRGTRDRLSHNIQLGADFFLSQNTTLFSSARYNIGNRGRNSDNIYAYFDENGVLNSYSQRITEGTRPRQGWDANLGLQHKFGGSFDHVLNADLSFSANTSEGVNGFSETFLANDYNTVIDDIALQNDYNNDKDQNFVIQLDYEKPMGENAKLEAGYKTIVDFSDDEFLSENFDYTIGDYVDNLAVNNRFKFTQQVHAIYGTYSMTIDKVSLQGGLRLEQAIMDSELVNTGEKFNKNYFSIFPSLNTSYKINETNQLQLNYSRRINRPRSRAINPFVNNSDPLNLRFGNPDLDPEYTDALELNYVKYFKSTMITGGVFYKQVRDVITRFSTVDEQGVRSMTFINLADSRNYGVELSAMYSPFNWWRMNGSFTYYRNEINDPNLEADINDVAVGWNSRISSNWSVWDRTLDIQFFMFIMGPRLITQGDMDGIYSASLSVRKKFFNNKLTVGVNTRDLFNSRRFRYTLDTNDFFSTGEARWDVRTFQFSLTYRFGSEDRSRSRRRRGGSFEGGDGMDGEMNF